MLLRAQNVNATPTANNTAKNPANNTAKNTAKNAPKSVAGRVAAKPVFTMRSLWRMALWGSTAVAALFVAILSSRSDVGSQRVAVVLSSLHLASPTLRAGQASSRVASQATNPATNPAANRAGPGPFDAESATRQLAQAVRDLTEDRDRLAARLAAVEHNVDDITGSITHQIEAAKAAPQPPQPWPNEQAPAATTPAAVAAVATPVALPPAGLASSPPSSLAADAAAPAAPIVEYGVDLGGGPTPNALRARWAGIRFAHPQAFAGLEPMAALRAAARSGRTELRLVVGPLTSPEAAARLCASLAPFRLPCRPTVFDGQRLAQR